MSKSLTSPTALLSVALRAAENPGVRFEVTHTYPAPAEGVGEGDFDHREGTRPSGESFWSRGMGTEIDLLTQRVHSRDAGGDFAVDQPVVRLLASRTLGGVRAMTWRGVTPGDPDFYFNFVEKLDILLTFDVGPWGRAAEEAVMLSEALEVTTWAAGVQASLPVTFIRSPSAAFTDSQLRRARDGDDPLLARGPTLRLTVGLDDADSDARIGLLETLTGFAARRGYGLRVADRRYGAISGRWIRLQILDREKVAAYRAELRDSGLGDLASTRAAMLTVVGASRRGAFAAVSRALRAAGIRPRGVTCLGIQDVSFFAAEIDAGVSGRREGATLPWPAGPGPATMPLTELVAARNAEPVDGELLDAARGYWCLLGAPFDLVPAPDAVLYPVWASWEVRDAPEGVSDSGTVKAIVDRFLGHPAVGQCRVEYYRFRRRSRNHIVERLKIGVELREPPTEADDVARVLSRVSLAVQQDLRRPGEWRLRHDDPAQAAQARLVSLRIAARERWLGTWLDDPH